LAHFLVDISNIDQVYVKYISKKRADVLNHPYFKKIHEFNREKLIEGLENKLKYYEFNK